MKGINVTYKIEALKPEFDEVICRIIKKTGAEFQAAGEGYGASDPEVLQMSKHYSVEKKSLYLVATISGKVVGGCGVAPFDGSDTVCELRKLFLLPESRGLGLGRELAQSCLDFAAAIGFTSCYLDTLLRMESAIKLYLKMGFRHLDKPLKGTIHDGCDVWMMKELKK